MIRYALACDDDHEFDAWFSTSDAYDSQAARGLVECPNCGSTKVRKQIMAPAVRTARKSEASRMGRRSHASETSAPEANAAPTASGAPDLAALARKVQAHIRSNFDYVGRDFAREATAIHDGEKPERLIYGETTPSEREALEEAGIACAPLPDAFAPTPAKKAN
jgi:hypothetical protein